MSLTKLNAAGKAESDFEHVSQFMGLRDKDRKWVERRANGDPATEFAQFGQFFEARSDTKKKKRVKENGYDGQVDTHDEEDNAVGKLSKEERRLARKKSKVEKAAKVNDLSEKESAQRTKKTKVEADQAPIGNSTTADEAIRKAERKRRKEERKLAKQRVTS